MKPRGTYTIVYTRDKANGWWVAEVKELKGCITQGRTIEQARGRTREALQAWFDLSKPFAGKLIDEVALPAPTRRKIATFLSARDRAAKANEGLSASSRAAVRELVDQGLSLRDAGELLGLTRQRAQQLLKTG
jgi:predicted RNase H-like HicB family nuclease